MSLRIIACRGMWALPAQLLVLEIKVDSFQIQAHEPQDSSGFTGHPLRPVQEQRVQLFPFCRAQTNIFEVSRPLARSSSCNDHIFRGVDNRPARPTLSLVSFQDESRSARINGDQHIPSGDLQLDDDLTRFKAKRNGRFKALSDAESDGLAS